MFHYIEATVALNDKRPALMGKSTVYLVDDHEMILPGLKLVVESDPGFTVVGHARDGHTAVKEILEKRPHVVVLDLSIPGLNGFEVAERLRGKKCGSKIIILTTYTEDRYIRRAMELRVSGYILKENPPSELLQALRAVADGHRFFAPRIMTRLLGALENLPEGGSSKITHVAFDSITPRELEVVRMIAGGKKGREICASLDISESTLKTHKANILKKLKLSSTNELIVYALENNIFTGRGGEDEW